MRKRIITQVEETAESAEQDWLDVARISEVGVTSEDNAHPVETALVPNRGMGWRAAGPGKQTIRLLFDHPQCLHRIWMNFGLTRDRQDRIIQFIDDGLFGEQHGRSRFLHRFLIP
jgi:hypothetical protein